MKKAAIYLAELQKSAIALKFFSLASGKFHWIISMNQKMEYQSKRKPKIAM